jgi:hypothetical protein
MTSFGGAGEMTFKKLTEKQRRERRRGTDPAIIAEKMKPDEEWTPQSLKRLAWAAQRLMAYKPVGDIRGRLNSKGRKLIKKMQKTVDSSARLKLFTDFAENVPGLAEAFAATTADDADPDTVATGEDLLRELPKIKWLWRNWIPRGMVTLLIAPPGLGKSSFALGAFANSVMTGASWPCGYFGPESTSKVLWIDAEHTQAETASRLLGWKLPAEKLILPGKGVFDTVKLDDLKNIAELRDLVRINRPDLCVVDSLRGSHRQDENNSTVGAVLEHLSALARDSGVAILVIHHTKKLSAGQEVDADSARGSNALIAVARSVIGLDRPDPDSVWVRARVVKANLTIAPRPIGFKITENGLKFGPAPEKPREDRAPAKKDAKEFLRNFLAGGPRPAAEVYTAAKKGKISMATLRRASGELNVKKPKGGKSVWSLPDAKPAQSRTGRKRRAS